LIGGADAFGLTALSSADFPSIVSGMHPGSALAMELVDIGPSGNADDYAGFDMLLLINLRNSPMPNPTLGAGAANFGAGLLTGGFANMPAFGGSGPQALTALPRNAVYATLVPTGTTNFRATVELFGGTHSVNAVNLAYGTPVYLDLPTPQIQSIVVNDGQVQRSRVTSVTVAFDELVVLPPNMVDAFTLLGPGNPGLAASDVSTATQTIVRLTFTGSAVQFGSLPDGNFSLVVLSLQVHDGFNQTLAANATSDFFRYFGDVNGDRTVNGLDLGFFRNAFGTQTGDPNYLSYLDFNGDGVINGFDLGQFRTRFGTVLP
jgi:hypothetical protein